mmetsp:Transcript_10602/g.16244  ORF Transcript_10602/g.16244 Transcript_10602/m.16244 type:complete len:261 (-) Transcript_10602:125-907(-)
MDVGECIVDTFGCVDLVCCNKDVVCGRNDDDSEYGNKRCLPSWVTGVFKLIVMVLDIVNAILDMIFVATLLESGSWGYAILMGFMTILSVVVVVAMKLIIYKLQEGQSWYSDTELERIFLFILLEYFVFMVEDATTILIFTNVSGIFDYHDSIMAQANIWTSIVSGVLVTLLLIAFVVAVTYWENDDLFERCFQVVFNLLIFAVFTLGSSYTIYIGIDKLILGNDINEDEKSTFTGNYALTMVISVLLMMCVVQEALKKS